MARRNSVLLIRLLCALALIVAALPLRAGVASCAPPVPTTAQKPAPKMRCCAKPSAPSIACCQAPSMRAAKASLDAPPEPCGCELRAAPPGAAPAPRALPTGPDLPVLVAILPEPVPEVAAGTPETEPGIRGTDAGPPRGTAPRAHASRAPPVARA